ncbi:MAG: glycosyltransferase family 4 protein [Candidatus Omnitrophica bacterium]|nr:glycosyltransferase family 4 protein [Candidatus Omnitrophota bacterium]
MIRILHLTTHLNIGGITSYIKLLTKEMRKLSYQLYVGSSGGTQEKMLEEEGIRCLKFNIRTKSELSPKLYLAIPQLIQLVKQEKIDLIHAHTRVTQVLAWWVQRFSKIPFVSTCHGFYKRRLGRRILPAWGNHVIAISKPVEESLLKDFHVRRTAVSTIFNAIDIIDLIKRYREKNPEAVRQELNLPKSSRVIGIVARVVEDKGHEYFLRAAAKLVLDSFPNVKILIVGEGPYLKNTKELVRRLRLEKSVCFLGNINDITYALSVIDIFVLPAIWREGFGLSIIEAMAVSKPVIVTNIWALNELVHDRENGLLVEPKDVDDLANAIRELLSDQDLYSKVSRNGSEMVRQEFSITQMANRVDRLYRQILSQPGNADKSRLTKDLRESNIQT